MSRHCFSGGFFYGIKFNIAKYFGKYPYFHYL